MAYINGNKILNINVTGSTGVGKGYVDNTFANALKGIAVGKLVSVNDASPIEHNLKVKLTSDTITDFSNVNVTQSGKNILPMIAWDTLTNGGVTYVRSDDDTLILNGEPSMDLVTLTINTTANTDFSLLKPNTDYSLTLIGIDGANLCLQTKKSNGTYGYYSQGKANFPETETVDRLFFQVKKSLYPTLENVVVKFQIEEGKVATEYEPSNLAKKYANADGTVEGFKSLPVMSFRPNPGDAKYVKINLEYNRDINKSLKFEKVYEGIIQDVTFDKPYTELYVKYECLAGLGADAGGYLDTGEETWAWFAGAEYIWYHFKLDGLCAWENVHRNEKINGIEFTPNAKGIVNFLMAPARGEFDNTTDKLTIYAR